MSDILSTRQVAFPLFGRLELPAPRGGGNPSTGKRTVRLTSAYTKIYRYSKYIIFHRYQELKEMEHKMFDDAVSKLPKSESNSFIFQKGDEIRDLIREHGVPSEPGVYIIYEITDKDKELVYIGKSGTWHRGEGFGKQMLDKRLLMKQDGEYRQDFFTKKVKKNKSKLEIHWYVTCDVDGKNGQLPAKVESDLMQAYFDDTGELPTWNNSF